MPAPSDPSGARTGERIAKLLARAGVASRREVERMIAEGRIKLGDAVVTTPATVLPNLEGVTVDGQPVRAAEAARLFAFHKPAGLITAERDPAGRPTIYTALRNALPTGTPRLMPVGRLDLNTEGLLLLTNDGELKRAMELPSSGIPRTYRARTFGDVTQAQLEELIEGVTIEGMHYGRIDANMERRTGRNQWIELTLTEGKNREVRRVLEHLGLQVSRLLRTRYGPFELLDLPRGAAAEVRQVDVERFVKGLNGGPEAIRPIASWVQSRSSPSAPEAASGARRAGRAAAQEKPPSGKSETAPRANRRRAAAPPASGRAAAQEKPPSGKPEAGPRAKRRRTAAPPASATAAALPTRAGPKPARKTAERDRGEKLIDRPKPPRRPSGWAKAKPRKPGPRRPGPKT